MAAATIKLFLIHGDPKRLRTAEVINWTGKAIGAPRTEFQELLERNELTKSGIYILTGIDPDTGKPQAYIGEAESLKERLPSHKSKDFWSQVIVFVSKDENLTKAHVRYLEGRLIDDTKRIGRFVVSNAQSSGAMLPESDREDMEAYLLKVHQLLPVLGSEIVTPIAYPVSPRRGNTRLTCEIKGLKAEGQRTSTGFVVFSESQAVSELRPSAHERSPYVVAEREKLLLSGSLIQEQGFVRFANDVEFSSPSAAAAIIHGGSANGMTAWCDAEGRSLKFIEAEEAKHR